MNALGSGHTDRQTHTHTDVRTKAISRNKGCTCLVKVITKMLKTQSQNTLDICDHMCKVTVQTWQENVQKSKTYNMQNKHIKINKDIAKFLQSNHL